MLITLSRILNFLNDVVQGLRHGPATYFHPSGSKEEATYEEGYENGPSVAHFARYSMYATIKGVSELTKFWRNF